MEETTPMSRDLDLLFEIGSLRYVPRGWLQHLAIHCASDLEHSVRVVFLALILARRSGKKVDEAKITMMALLHDIAETRVSDLSYVQKVYVKADEPRALADMFAGTILASFADVVTEYERRDTLEAKIVKDADNLDIDIELKEIEEQGHNLPKKLHQLRKMIRDEKLYTDEARALWDEIQTSDPARWHISANKYLTIPEAGR